MRRLLPGLLVAATGLGAGDLITASLAGSAVGLGLLWAVVVGAALKWLLNEGLARWQLATGTTLIEGWSAHLGRWIEWTFLAYFLVWSFVVGGALMNACGVAGTGLIALGEPDTSRTAWAVIHSLVGLALVRRGGFRVFETAMALSIALMAACVLATAVRLQPDWAAVGAGLTRPAVPAGGLGWTLGVMGGVGGTVTLLSYGYWIREHGRRGAEALGTCRLDLGVAYGLTALFGISMVVIGSRITVTGSGSNVALALADQLAEALGPFGRTLFLLGFWGAVFSSLLGVWQGVPYLFADFLAARRGSATPSTEATASRAYRRYQLALAIVPMVLLRLSVPTVQLLYAVLGALFLPLLALTLLLLNNRRGLLGTRLANGPLTNAGLVCTLLVFVWIGASEIVTRLA